MYKKRVVYYTYTYAKTEHRRKQANTNTIQADSVVQVRVVLLTSCLWFFDTRRRPR